MPSKTDPFDHPVVEQIVAPAFRLSKWDDSPTARLELLAGRDQAVFERATIMLVGLGAQSIVAQGLLRSGATRIIGIDPDYFASSNFSRQIGYSRDRGKPKAHSVLRNVARDAVKGAELTSIALPFPQALSEVRETPAVVSCLVDDNACRVAVSRYAKEVGIPAVISGLSLDGVRSYTFLQMPGADEPCLGCVFPEMNPVRAACVAATIKTVYQAAATILHFIDVALMGWPADSEPYNLRFADLHGLVERTGMTERRPGGCWLCGE